MKRPVLYRKGIPFFCNKSERDFQADDYERYDSMVLRQTAIHLADQLWGNYPMQNVLDFAREYYPENSNKTVVEIGCGVGRWIATLAQTFPNATCWGIDYSYQMLKQANEFWVLGKDIIIDLSKKGFPIPLGVEGHKLNNLKFGLAKATELPFSNSSQDMILNSFLFDRISKPTKSLIEFHRVLKLNGTLIIIAPLNFNEAKHWETLYPPVKIHDLLIKIGFEIIAYEEEIRINEPLDAHGNMITWKCVGFVARKA